MTTVEAGVAIGQPYPKHEERATAIHEAGHAVCGHLYMENRHVDAAVDPQARLHRRPPPGDGEIEDRFGHWRSEEVGDLIWGLGAMAAEHVFYGQNTTGVGGDLGIGHRRTPRTWSASPAWRRRRSTCRDRIARPRGARGGRGARHGALREDRLPDHAPLRRASIDGSPYAATLGDRGKRKLVAGLLGQAFVVAWNTIRVNNARPPT